jgi:ketosteroid isomerase-like protein
MSDLQAIADSVEIEALRGEYTDAAMMNDYDRLASLFTPDGAMQWPHASLEFVGQKAIRAAGERREAVVDYFIQTTHPGMIQLDGDTASGRAYMFEAREHAGAEVGARDRSLAQGCEDPQARAGAAAHVQSPAERAERTQRAGGRVKHAIGGAERRVVELRGQQVIAALDRRQRLHRQFTHRRAPGREHRPRVLPQCQAGRQPRVHPPHRGQAHPV